MNKRILPVILLILSFAPAVSVAQNYVLPLDLKYKPTLSANFGELRAANLHAGLDFKTGGVEGIRVLAAAKGYVYRISIRPAGYGRAVYIAHPDGTATVYGHLSAFTPEMDEYVAARQYKEKKNTIDIFPPPGMFFFEQGDMIGSSGNSGRSYGPHLHFEIRDRATDRLYSPLILSGFGMDDTVPPEIRTLYYYAVDTVAGVPVHTRISAVKPEKTGEGKYRLAAPFSQGRKGYFAVEVVDYKNNTSNTMAVRSISMEVDGETRFEYIMDTFTYDQAAYAPAVALYELNRSSRFHVVRLAVMPRVDLPFYGKVVDRGVIDPEPDKEIRITVDDDSGNQSTLVFTLGYDEDMRTETILAADDAVTVQWNQSFSKMTDGLTVTIPARSLYEPMLYSQYKLLEPPVTSSDASVKVLSPFYSIGDESIPLKSAINIEIEENIPEEYRSRAILAKVNGGRSLASAGGSWANGKVAGKAGSFGTYCIVADTRAPQVSSAFKKGADLSANKTMTFSVSDNFSGIASYTLEIDGQWAIVEYDYLRARFIHKFDDARFGTGKNHTVVVTVKDGAGNTNKYTTEYYR